jgi:hypothetical protein
VPIVSAGLSGVRQVTVTLSSADILALNTTPITLVAGVPGNVVVPIVLYGVMTPGATLYTFAAAFRVFNGATFGTSGFGASTPALVLALTAAVPTQSVQLSPFADSGEASALNAGQPLRLDVNGAATLGNGTGAVTTVYTLVPA